MAGGELNLSNVNVSAGVLAGFLDITERRVNQLAREKVLTRLPGGAFSLKESTLAYYTYKLTPTEKYDHDKEAALLMAAKRERAVIDLELIKGTLLYASDVEKAVSEMILTCKARLLAIPSKVAPTVIGQTNLAVIISLMEKEVFAALDELKEMPASSKGGAVNAAD